MDNKNTNVSNKIDNALSVILDFGEKILNESQDNMKFGWVELSVGDSVFFKTFDDVNDTFAIAKGEIIEVITTEKKVLNRPDNNMKSSGWHRERFVSYKIRWNGMTATVDPKYVYTDKKRAVVAALYGTVKSYLEN